MLDIEREEKPAYVRFENRPIEDKVATLKAGRSICKDIHYALVTPPYSKDCVEYKVTTWLSNMEQNIRNGRIPKEWARQWKAAYEAWKEGQEAPVNGTDIRNWSVVSPAQVKNLISAGCRTVEDLAQANDQALRYIGMGANELKRKAISYLQAAKDHGPVVLENDRLARENDQLKGTIESLKAQVNRLTSETHSLSNAKLEIDDPVEQGIGISDIIEPVPIELQNWDGSKYKESDDELEAARSLYKEKFGKNPHPFAKVETIMNRLDK